MFSWPDRTQCARKYKQRFSALDVVSPLIHRVFGDVSLCADCFVGVAFRDEREPRRALFQRLIFIERNAKRIVARS